MTRSNIRPYFFGVLAWIVSFFIGLNLGAVEDASFELIADVRLPRTLLASSVGMGLSVAGAALQALFSNPLCEPYTLGISSGAALGAVIGVSLGVQWMLAGVTGTAFIGAALFAGILYVISLRRNCENLTLLLTGVMLGFLGNSLVAIWVALSETNGIQSAINWLFGDLSQARLKGSIFSSFGVLVASILLWFHWGDLDGLLMGEEGARSLGVDVARVRRRIITFSSLLIAICVSAGGMIGFVGLVIPHFARRWAGSLHQKLLPLCAIWGAVALCTADWVSRIVIRPYELPVGIVTSLIGAPVFVWILLQKSRQV
jgi:ABC-type Fe3+-siderophore transport system permease subunit